MKMPSSATGSPEASANVPHRAWITVGILWAAFVINYVDRQVVFSISPALRSELGFSSAQLGLVGSVFIWVYSLCCPLVGRFADVARREILITASLILWSLATLGTGFARGVGDFLIWRAIMGVTEALFIPAALSVIGSVHPGATRSRALALFGSGQRPESFSAPGTAAGWRTLGDRGRRSTATARTLPATGTFGNAGRSILRGSFRENLDFGGIKEIAIAERHKLQLR